MVIDADEPDVPRKGSERAVAVPCMAPDRLARRRSVAQAEHLLGRVELVAAADAGRAREVVVGVGPVVAAVAVVECEGVERGAHALAQHLRVGDDHHEGILPAARPPAEEAVEEVGRDAQLRLVVVDVRERESAGIAPVRRVGVALPVHRALSVPRARRGERARGTGSAYADLSGTPTPTRSSQAASRRCRRRRGSRRRPR